MLRPCLLSLQLHLLKPSSQSPLGWSPPWSRRGRVAPSSTEADPSSLSGPQASAKTHQYSSRFQHQVCKSTNTYLHLILETSSWSPDLSQTSKLNQTASAKYTFQGWGECSSLR
ncbi:unnamed protein product [Rangifer tarandus platyrhynchus]|uniref:Uncharacterized protein n=1 Tax=Rangifer tarandus platyrhynchus TaxID=3082113 RepID=A0AC59ZQ64_RANTA